MQPLTEKMRKSAQIEAICHSLFLKVDVLWLGHLGLSLFLDASVCVRVCVCEREREREMVTVSDNVNERP